MKTGHKRRRGGWLVPHAVEMFYAFDGMIETLDRVLGAQGYSRPGEIQPYLRGDGGVTIRIVWRRRGAGLSVVHSATYPTVGPPRGAA